MAVPKRKKSKSKTRTRRSALKAHIYRTHVCPKCGATKEPHRVCKACGYYRNRQVLTVEAD